MVTLEVSLTWTCAVVSAGVPREPGSAELAPGPGGAVRAAEAAAGVGMTDLDRALRVCVPAAVTRDTNAGRLVETRVALVALRAGVRGETEVTHRGAAGVCRERRDGSEPGSEPQTVMKTEGSPMI